MAQSQLNRESISCPICLDLLKDPVALPCGHSYCMNCLKNHWDSEDEKNIYSCPQCRQTFTPRPVLVKNAMLAALVEQLKKTGLTAAPLPHCYAGAEDVACDVCTGRKLKAFRSCLVCRVSYCEKHLQPHHDVPQFKKHQLVEPSNKLQENICSRHDEVMKMFCRTDQLCICYLCSLDEHKDHDTVSAAAERTERQRELEGRRPNVQQRIQNRRRDQEELQQEEEDINRSADGAVDHIDQSIGQLSRLLEDRGSGLKQQVRRKQQTEVSRVKELQEELQQEVTELERTDAGMEKLSHTEDLKQFLQDYASLPALSEDTRSPSVHVQRPLRHFEDVTAAVTELRDKLQDVLTETRTNVSQAVGPEPTRDQFLRCSSDVTLDPNAASRKLFLSEENRKVTSMTKDQPLPDQPHRLSQIKEPQQDVTELEKTNVPQEVKEGNVLLPQREPTRDQFLKCSRDVTLDPNAANRYLLLSQENRKVTRTRQDQFYPEHPDRFTHHLQVLSKESLTGCCYWEVEIRGAVRVAVSYKNIRRVGGGDECFFGRNDKSWSLLCDDKSYIFYHNKVQTLLSGPRSSRVGVHLDHPAGVLSFYSVSNIMTLLHRVQTRFTQPLHAGLCVYDGSSAEIIRLR